MIRHYPVMYRNILQKIQSLNYSRILKIADCNFGFGGHSHKILKNFKNTVIQGFDLDSQVLKYYKQHYFSQLTQSQQQRLKISNTNYRNLLTQNIFNQYDIILADFGFNTYHISTARGFTWLHDQQLDMRYNNIQNNYNKQNKNQSCRQLIQRSTLLQLRQIIQKYTDLKQSKYIAESIFNHKPIKTTFQLRDAVVGCFQKDKQKKITQVFQAFRIATNNQLEDVQKLCDLLEKRLAPNGIALLITFHSIERDRVMNKIKQKRKIYDKIIIDQPSKQQLQQNSMSRSAKLLSFRKKM